MFKLLYGLANFSESRFQFFFLEDRSDHRLIIKFAFLLLFVLIGEQKTPRVF